MKIKKFILPVYNVIYNKYVKQAINFPPNVKLL